MKKLFLIALAVLVVACLAACGEKKEPENKPVDEVVSGEVATTPEPTDVADTQNAELYEAVINDYKAAFAFFSLDDIDGEEKLAEECKLVNTALVAHICRYSDAGAELTYDYYDIDKNGVDELIVGVSDSPEAIYSYDKANNVPVKIFFQETIERGSLSIYDNGSIYSEGSGGAALHYFEFGKMSADGLSFESLEKVEEEYLEEDQQPVYRNPETGETLAYTSFNDVADKYIANAEIVGF